MVSVVENIENVPDDAENSNESGEEATLVENSDEKASLVESFDEDSRPSQDRRAPDCYNPDTGLSYAQKAANHNIICQYVSKNC